MNVRQLMKWFSAPPLSAPRATVLIRTMAGSVFLWEGVLKFVYANQGVGRFTKFAVSAGKGKPSFVKRPTPWFA